MVGTGYLVSPIRAVERRAAPTRPRQQADDDDEVLRFNTYGGWRRIIICRLREQLCATTASCAASDAGHIDVPSHLHFSLSGGALTARRTCPTFGSPARSPPQRRRHGGGERGEGLLLPGARGGHPQVRPPSFLLSPPHLSSGTQPDTHACAGALRLTQPVAWAPLPDRTPAGRQPNCRRPSPPPQDWTAARRRAQLTCLAASPSAQALGRT